MLHKMQHNLHSEAALTCLRRLFGLQRVRQRIEYAVGSHYTAMFMSMTMKIVTVLRPTTSTRRRHKRPSLIPTVAYGSFSELLACTLKLMVDNQLQRIAYVSFTCMRNNGHLN